MTGRHLSLSRAITCGALLSLILTALTQPASSASRPDKDTDKPARAAHATPQPTPKPALLVLSKTAHTLSIVDPATLQTVARMPVGPDPHEVVASADGTHAYVSIYGFGTYHELDAFDLVHQRALTPIDVAPLSGPHGLVFAAGKVWFTAEGSKAIARYDPATHKVDWILGIGQDRTHMLYLMPGETTLYTANVNSGTISILHQVMRPTMMPPPALPPSYGIAPTSGQPPSSQSPASGAPMRQPPLGARPRPQWLQTNIKVGAGDEGFDVTPDGRELWTANADDATLSIVDLRQEKLVATLPDNVRHANRLKFTLDGRYALISDLGSGDLVIFDVATRQLVKRLAIGHGSAGILMEPGGKRAFVSCGPDSYVAVIDLASLTVAGHIATGGDPDGLAWAR